MDKKLDREIVDSHCHFWDLSLGYYGWISDRESDLLGNLGPINKNYLPEDYLKDSEGYQVKKCIHIEAASTRYAKQEVMWLIELSKQSNILGAVVAGIDLLDEASEALLAFYGSQPLVKGVRQTLNWSKNSKYTSADRPDDLRNPIWQRHYGTLKKYNLSFDMQICPTQMNEAWLLIKNHPDIKVIINHAGMPIEENISDWKKGIRLLSGCENVFIKLSGFGMLDHFWTENSIEGPVRYIIDCFGIERCLFASNFPVDRLYSNFSKIVEFYSKMFNSASIDEKEKFFYKNAENFYDLE